MTNLEKIKQAIIKANPSILDLKFGCYVQIPQNGGDMYCYRVIETMNSNCYEDLKPKTYDGNVCHEVSEEIILARNQAITDDVLERFAIKDIKIIGRPIQLDDCALIVKDKHYLIDNWKLGYLNDQDEELLEWILAQ